MSYAIMKPSARAAFSVAAVLLAITAVTALEQGLPSKTAIYVAAARAVGSRNPDPRQRNPDYLAIKFIGRSERTMLSDPRLKALDMPFALAVHRIGDGNVAEQTRRTKWFDKALLDALALGAQQVVILGAGFDSRAYRFTGQIAGRPLFEVDYGPTQQYKRRRLREIIKSIPSNVRFVAMDFTKDTLLDQLVRAGYSEQARTVFLWEGVVAYIPESAVKETLHFVRAHSGPGSSIAFNYPLAKNFNVHNTTNQYARWGEPWIFGFPGDRAADYVRGEGLEITSDELTGPAEGECIAVVPPRSATARRSTGVFVWRRLFEALDDKDVDVVSRGLQPESKLLGQRGKDRRAGAGATSSELVLLRPLEREVEDAAERGSD